MSKERKTKWCYKCDRRRNKSKFYKCSDKSDGLQSCCIECTNKANSVWYKNNTEYKLKKNKEWKVSNPEQVKKEGREYQLKRRKEDINYNLACKLRDRARSAAKNKGVRKNGSAVDDLGCTVDDFRKYLESKFYPNPRTGEMMSWQNYGKFGWHIDHIIPLVNFNLEDREQFLKACYYTNLQPLWWFENLKKSRKVEKK